MKKKDNSKKITKLKKKILPILRRNNVTKSGIFGSFVRGEAGKNSDIDILVEFKGRKSLLDLARLEIELEKVLKRKVDLGEYSVIHPLLRERILKEEVRIL